MNNLPSIFEDQIIDTELLNQTFPIGLSISLFLDDDKDEDILKSFSNEEVNINHWDQYMISDNTCNVGISDGQVFFINKKTKNMLMTTDTVVKSANDVRFLSNPTLLSEVAKYCGISYSGDSL